MKFSVKKVGGFSLGTSSLTGLVFSDDGTRFATIAGNRVQVWDMATRSRITICKSQGLTWLDRLALNTDGSRLAMHGDNLIDVLDVASGERISRIKHMQAGDNVLLSPDGRTVFEATGDGPAGSLRDSGEFKPDKTPGNLGPGFFVWNADTGDLLQHHGLPPPLRGHQSDFMATGLSRSRSGRLVVASFMAKPDAAKHGITDFSLLWTELGVQKIETGLGASSAVISPDGERIFVAGVCTQKKVILLRLIDRSGAVLIEKEMGQFDTFPVSRLAWSPDGRKVSWFNKGLSYPEVWLLNAATLEIQQKIIWPGEVIFGPQDWIALTGHSGIMVLPCAAVGQAVEQIGQPAADLARSKQRAYARAIELGKASPPRAALFLSGERLRIEVEQLVGIRRYLPVDEVFYTLERADAESIGRTVREALGQFRLGFAPEESRFGERDWLPKVWPSDDFSTYMFNHDLPLEWAIPAHKREQVRYLLMLSTGQRPPDFPNPSVAIDARYIVVTHHGGLLELWPGITAAGTFNIDHSGWPHIPLADTVTDGELGAAVLTAFEQCAVKKK